MLDEIYDKKILELAANIPRLGRLEKPDASATAHSRLCGSTVAVDIRIADGRVSDFAHDVKACALGQASSSIMARHVVGSTPGEFSISMNPKTSASISSSAVSSLVRCLSSSAALSAPRQSAVPVGPQVPTSFDDVVSTVRK